MNNHEINRILRSHHLTRKIFLAAAPCNVPANIKKYPYALILNTDDSSGPGRHWIAIYAVSPSLVEFFDPAGMPPNECQKKFLKNFKTIIKNNKQLQSFYSSVCGHYCIYFIIKRCYGETFTNIINTLDRMGEVRDSYVREYISQLEQCITSQF
jgi:hypothetical protein